MRAADAKYPHSATLEFRSVHPIWVKSGAWRTSKANGAGEQESERVREQE